MILIIHLEHVCAMKTANFNGRSVQSLCGLIEILQNIRKIKPFSYRVLKDDCLDLPPKTFMKRVFQLSPEQKKKLYDK